MRGEAVCRKAPDDNVEGRACCIHACVRNRDYVCCWCGNLFQSDEDVEHGRHGQYKPRRKTTS